MFSLTLARIIFYDAALEERISLLDAISKIDYVSIKLGRVRPSDSNRFKQKGVDVLMAIDLISKAFRDQYDIAVIITGDDDFWMP